MIDVSEAVYHQQLIKDYEGNPFLEALPPVLSDVELISRLQSYPSFNEEERNYPKELKVHFLNRLQDLYIPIPTSLEIAKSVDLILRNGYIDRNPLTRGFLEKSDINDNNSSKTALGSLIVGPSGVGKTTTINRLLKSLYPHQVVVHTRYRDTMFSAFQIRYIKIEVGPGGSIKSVCLNILSEIDRLTGTQYYNRAVKNRTSIDHLLMNVYQVTRGVGLIIIDEIQNINQSGVGGRRIMHFFNNLSNFGVPILKVGTPQALSILNDFRNARRNVGLNSYFELDRLKQDREWGLIVHGIWKYQWTNGYTVLNRQLENTIYELTQGIPDLLVKLFQNVQLYCISKSLDTFNVDILYKVFKKNMKPINRAIVSLKNDELIAASDIVIPKVPVNKTSDDTNSVSIEHHVIKENPKNEEDIRLLIASSELSPYEALLKAGYIKDALEL